MAASTGSIGVVASRPSEQLSAALEQRMRSLPSHGWTGGWIGRRDRALLVLSEMAGLTDETIAELKVADITVSDGVATIRTASGTRTLDSNTDDLLCAPCALARWLHALDMTVLYPSGPVIAAVIARCAPLTAHSPHLCQGSMTLTPATEAMLLLPASERLHSTPPQASAAQLPTSSRRPGGVGRIPTQRSGVAPAAGW